MSERTQQPSAVSTQRRPAEPRNAGALFSSALRRRGVRLMNQQCWCWGQDVRRPDGNVLLAYGFNRQRPPAGSSGSSVYTLPVSSDACVTLWGFGILYGERDAGGVFLSRSGFQPLLAPYHEAPPEIWFPGELPDLTAPATPPERQRLLDLLAGAIDWIGAYEDWVRATLGVPYREATLALLPNRPLPPLEVADGWRTIAAACTRPCDGMEPGDGSSTAFGRTQARPVNHP